MLTEPPESESLAALDLFIMTLRDLAFNAKRGETGRLIGAPYLAPRRPHTETALDTVHASTGSKIGDQSPAAAIPTPGNIQS